MPETFVVAAQMVANQDVLSLGAPLGKINVGTVCWEDWTGR